MLLSNTLFCIYGKLQIFVHSKNQGILIETIQQENRKYSENKDIEEFTKMVKIMYMQHGLNFFDGLYKKISK